MLPALDDLVAGFSLYSARRRINRACDPRALGAALREAEKLAAGHEDDEPAALFYALARRPRAAGLDLTFTAIELDIHIIRVLRGEMTFVEIRGWFAARLVPISRRP